MKDQALIEKGHDMLNGIVSGEFGPVVGGLPVEDYTIARDFACWVLDHPDSPFIEFFHGMEELLLQMGVGMRRHDGQDVPHFAGPRDN